MRIKLILLLTALALMFSVPTPAMAERFADMYIGWAIGQDTDLTGTINDTTTTEEAEFEYGLSAGYRMGYWFEGLSWVGLALEISYFNQEIKDLADLRIIPLTPLLMLRIPILKSNEFPAGEWQPYIAAGPGFFMSDIELKGSDYSDDYYGIGLDARGGIKKFFFHNFATFIEYRYTNLKMDYEPVIEEFDLVTHHVLFGITVNY